MEILFKLLTWFYSLDPLLQWIGWIFNEGVCKDGEGVDWWACVDPTHWLLSSVLVKEMQ